jgi:Na+-translocating ferredoxin:NAD+ oxidoreductase RnfG subunit
MKKIILFLILFISNLTFAGSIKDEIETLIREKLDNSVTTEFIKYEITEDLKHEIERETRQRFYSDFVYIYKIFNEKNLQNIAIVDNVLGKSMPITFLVIFDLTGKINSSRIVKYREQYGGGVKSEDWNEQFKGKDSKSGYKVGKDISAISGATISATSVTRGIRKLTLLFDKIKDTL